MVNARPVDLVSAVALAAFAALPAQPAGAAGLGLTLEISIEDSTINGIPDTNPTTKYILPYSLDGGLVTSAYADNDFFEWSFPDTPSSPIAGLSGVVSNPSGSDFIGSLDTSSLLNSKVRLSESSGSTLLELEFAGLPSGLESSASTAISGITASVLLAQSFVSPVACGASCTIADVFSANNILNGSLTTIVLANSSGAIFTNGEGGSNFNVIAASGSGAPVPAPLPVLGAGSAFCFSRRLRRRINLQADR